MNSQTVTLKRQILKSVKQIKRAAESTHMTGKLELHYSGIELSVWDEVVNSISEYPRYQHYLEVGKRLQIALLLD